MIKVEDNYIEKRYDDELLLIEPWGKNSLRVRSFLDQKKVERNNALTENSDYDLTKVQTFFNNSEATIVNGKIKATLDHRDRLTFYNEENEVLLEEFIRLRAVKHDDGSEDVGTIEITNDFNSTLKLKSREYKANNDGANFHTKVRFEPNKNEKIYGMGQYQQPYLDLKNTMLELAQRNTQMSVPFYISSKNYGFLWNNPGIGKVTFAKNITEWEMYGTNYIDYWITAGENAKEITKQYTNVTGRVPEMPKGLLGLWQSKLRYRTPEEVLEVVEGYRKRDIQLSTIAIDYFHWPKQGEYRFDKDFWPDPEGLVQTLKEDYGVEPIISIWPTVQSDAYNYEDYLQGGYLVKVNRGIRLTMQIQGNTVFLDTTNPEARDYVWRLIKNNYKDIGIDYYWVDVAEPGYAAYDFDNYRYYSGTALEVGNLYPNAYLKMVYEGNKATNHKVVTLVRGSWAGAQKYGALAWSGDIDSSFASFNNQVNTGLNMGMAGIPWWTTDIGGFHGGDPQDTEFKELMVRWFQYSTFSPILRMHGDRLPHSRPLSDSGGGSMPTGAPNEIWSYGSEVEGIVTKYIKVREYLQEYLMKTMEEAHEYGYPVMRTLFYEFPKDKESWEVDNTYLLGSDILVAPIMNYKDRSREVYLPSEENWINLYSGQEYTGGVTYEIEASLEQIPAFVRSSSSGQFKELLAYTKENLK